MSSEIGAPPVDLSIKLVIHKGRTTDLSKASIPGQSKPQGTFYSPDFNTLFVTNGTDGTCKIFRGDNFKLIDSLLLGSDANQAGYDPDTKYLYAGLGDRNSGALAIVDTSNN